MSDVNVPSFSGPITAVALNEWLLRCERAFDLWEEEQDPPKKLKPKLKVDLAGNAISSDGDTHDLADWWVDEGRNITQWVAFKDGVKEKALGAFWRDLALQAYYLTKQETADQDGTESYIRALDENRSVIDNDSQLKSIDDLAFRCHMLFHSLPAVTAQIMDNDFDVVNATVSQIETKVRHVSSLQASSTPVPTLSSGVTGYLLLAQWGIDTGTAFSHFDKLPNDPREVEPMSSITLWGNNDQSYYMLEDFELAFPGGSISGPAQTPKSEHKTYNFAAGEFITGVVINATEYQKYPYYSTSTQPSGFTSVCSIAITTSTGSDTKLSLGKPGTTSSAFIAPSGWKIVGFRGKTTSYYDYGYYSTSGQTRYPIVRFGVVMAPVNGS